MMEAMEDVSLGYDSCPSQAAVDLSISTLKKNYNSLK